MLIMNQSEAHAGEHQDVRKSKAALILMDRLNSQSTEDQPNQLSPEPVHAHMQSAGDTTAFKNPDILGELRITKAHT